VSRSSSCLSGFAHREYTFAFEDGRLVEMALRLTGQACVG